LILVKASPTRERNQYDARRSMLGLISSATVGLATGVRAATRPTIETADMQAVKTRLSVPAELASCHSAEIAGYIIEGHVPAQAINRPDSR
jgi:hypothetical protein